MTDINIKNRRANQGIMSLSFRDKASLYEAYMPFVINGGLFISTRRDYPIGQEVYMLINLMEETERLPVIGTIIWKTPQGAEGYKATGVGIQFSTQDNGLVRSKIENYLAGALEAERPTHTM